MARTSTLKILRPHFNMPASLSWFAVGLVVGMSAWVWGRSALPASALAIVSGFGGMLVLPLCVTGVLAIIALSMKNRVGYLAYGDFRNVLPWMLGQLLRSASVFFGLVVVAAVCWGVSGNGNALATAMLGMVLGGALTYCWGSLVLMSDELANRA
jgi:hypothetical protein